MGSRILPKTLPSRENSWTCRGNTLTWHRKATIPAPSQSAAGMMVGAKPLPLFSTTASTSTEGWTELANPCALPSISSMGLGKDSANSSIPAATWREPSLTFSVLSAKLAVPVLRALAPVARSSS